MTRRDVLRSALGASNDAAVERVESVLAETRRNAPSQVEERTEKPPHHLLDLIRTVIMGVTPPRPLPVPQPEPEPEDEVEFVRPRCRWCRAAPVSDTGGADPFGFWSSCGGRECMRRARNDRDNRRTG